MKKDFTGKEVNIGDYIFYSTTSRWPESRIGRITRFTVKSMFVEIIKRNRPYSPREEVIVKNDFVKIDYSE